MLDIDNTSTSKLPFTYTTIPTDLAFTGIYYVDRALFSHERLYIALLRYRSISEFKVKF